MHVRDVPTYFPTHLPTYLPVPTAHAQYNFARPDLCPHLALGDKRPPPGPRINPNPPPSLQRLPAGKVFVCVRVCASACVCVHLCLRACVHTHICVCVQCALRSGWVGPAGQSGHVTNPADRFWRGLGTYPFCCPSPPSCASGQHSDGRDGACVLRVMGPCVLMCLHSPLLVLARSTHTPSH